MKDLEQEKQEEEKEKTKEKEPNWFQKVPTVYKLAGVGLIFFKYLSIANKKGNINELWLWVIGVLIAWYFLGAENKKRDSGILTPEEAERALNMEIDRKIKAGQISRGAKIYVGPNNGLFYNDGLPQHYQIQIEIHDDDDVIHKRGIVFAEGDTKGYATIQDTLGKLTGREVIPVVSPLPGWLRRSKKYDLGLDKYIFGSGDKK